MVGIRHESASTRKFFEGFRRRFVALIDKMTAGLGRVDQRFVREYLTALIARRVPVLCRMASEPFCDTTDLRHTVKRWSRRLNSKLYDAAGVREKYLRLIEPELRSRDSLPVALIIDQTDILKHPWARAEGVGPIFDGSRREPGRGYALAVAAARVSSDICLPLSVELTSPSPDTCRSMLIGLRPYLPEDTIVVADRGFRGQEHHKAFLEAGFPFIVRLSEKARYPLRIWIDGRRSRITEAEAFSERISQDLPDGKRVEIFYRDNIRLSAKTAGGHSKPQPGARVYGLIIVRHSGYPPRYLLTSRRIASDMVASQLAAVYQARWDIEQGFRFIKSKGLNLESICLRNLTAMRRAVFLIVVAWGLIALMVLRSSQLRTHLSKTRFVGKPPPNVMYRTLIALSEELLTFMRKEERTNA